MLGYIAFLKKLISLIPFNIFDYIVIIVFLLYIFEGISLGLVSGAIGFVSTISAFFIGLALYHPLSAFMVEKLSLPKGISDAGAFLIVVSIAFSLISGLFALLRKKYLSFKAPKNLDSLGGAFFGFLSFFFIASFLIALLLSFPISGVVKDPVRNSVTGRFLSSQTQGFEKYVRQIFGGAIEDTINFSTVEPGSNQSLSLNFKTTSGTVDSRAEQEMLELVNIERNKNGLPSLAFDESLTELAESHAKDMLARGYFSHYTPEGLSPFDRMEQANISYQYAGENLAFAPDVNIAETGLMKSPGHRANILSPNFKKVGIGVINAGIYGEMFVQEFTD